MKSRFLILMMGLLMVLAMGADAYAQATFQVSAGATQGRMNGHTEEAGGITLAVTSGTIGTGEGDNGTVLIDYGVPITNAIGAATVDNSIAVEICGEPREVADSADVDVEGNTITVTVADDTDCTANESINVEGVRLSLVGSGLDNITASVTATGDVRLLGGANTVVVMNSIVDELTDDGIDVGKKLTLIRHTGVLDADSKSDDPANKFKLLIMENTVRAFDDAQINLAFSGIPDDVEVTIDAWVAKASDLEEDDFVVDQTLNQVVPVPDGETEDFENDQLSINKAGTLLAVITSEDDKASVLTKQIAILNDGTTDDVDERHTGGMLTSERDVVIVLGRIDGADEDELLPLNLDIQVTVDVGPIGVAKPKGDQSTSIPRFASDKTTAVTVIESTSAQTVMEVAYVLSEGAYDTGIAVSNMTDDQAGAVHFALYMNGEEMKYSTPSMMQPQTTMSVLLSEVLRMAGHTGRFGGYMIITADFTKADAGVFVSDFAGFTAGATVRMNN
jgi:hypothetical protein